MRAAIDTLVALATKHRLVCIQYRKLSNQAPTMRVVEPYRFVESPSTGSMMIQCWQVKPAPDAPERPCWKNFLVDGIEDVSDGGDEFKPRRPLALAWGEVTDFMQQREIGIARSKIAEEYRRQFLAAIRDGRLDDDERRQLEELSDELPTAKKKVIHAQVFQDCLFDVLLDHKVDAEEDEFLSEVRSFMDSLGWSP